MNKTAELLSARRTLMRRFNEQNELKPPSIKQLQKHAEKFGSAVVVETAVDSGHAPEACLRLAVTCERLDRKNRKRYMPRKTKLSPEKLVKSLFGVEPDEKIA